MTDETWPNDTKAGHQSLDARKLVATPSPGQALSEKPKIAVTRSSSRYGFIDAIRGIAACLVMLQHSLYQSGFLGNWPSATLTGFIPNWLELGETGVVAFFLVSGFVIPLSLEKTDNFRLFWIHRALRIYPLYLAIFALTFAVRWGGDIASIRTFFLDAGAHLLFLQEYLKQEEFVGGSWTLSLEMIWYIGLSSLFLLSLNRKTTLLVGLTVIVSVMAQLACANGLHLPMGRLSMLVCCVLGLVCYRHECGAISQKTFVTLFVILVSTIVLNIFVGLQLFPSANPTASFKEAIDSWALAGAVFFVPYFMRRTALWTHSIFGFLGRISYSIYLLHPVVLYLLWLAGISGIALIGIVFSVTIAASVLTYRFIESPPIRFGHSLKVRRKVRVAA